MWKMELQERGNKERKEEILENLVIHLQRPKKEKVSKGTREPVRIEKEGALASIPPPGRSPYIRGNKKQTEATSLEELERGRKGR